MWWCNAEVHRILDRTHTAVYAALGPLQENILQYTENAETFVKNTTRSIAKSTVSSQRSATLHPCTLAYVQRQRQPKTFASATTPTLSRFLARPTDQRKLAGRKLCFPLRFFFGYVFRPWARVSRHDTSSLAQRGVQGRSDSIHPCGVRTPGSLWISPSVYDLSLRPPPPGDIHPQYADLSPPLPPPSRPQPWMTPTSPTLGGREPAFEVWPRQCTNSWAVLAASPPRQPRGDVHDREPCAFRRHRSIAL